MTPETINNILGSVCDAAICAVPILAFVGGLIYLNHERA